MWSLKTPLVEECGEVVSLCVTWLWVERTNDISEVVPTIINTEIGVLSDVRNELVKVFFLEVSTFH